VHSFPLLGNEKIVESPIRKVRKTEVEDDQFRHLPISQ
jgi:hypothetical protein